MNELVFLEPNRIDAEPFTTSKVIADVTGIRHDKIKASILKHEPALAMFGKLTSYGDALGGRGNESGYRLSEPQSTLLITFLKNTSVVVMFKTELVRQFYAMREELTRRRVERIQLKPIRREMIDVIRQMDTDKWAYKKYTDLAYMMVTGKIARKLRDDRGAPKAATAIDYMTAEEIHAVTQMTYRIGVLLEVGMSYQQIKAALALRLAG